MFLCCLITYSKIKFNKVNDDEDYNEAVRKGTEDGKNVVRFFKVLQCVDYGCRPVGWNLYWKNLIKPGKRHGVFTVRDVE